MSVSKQDWKQWHDTHWDGCQRAVVELSRSFEETLAALNASEAERFLALTDGDNADGLFQTAIAAEHTVTPASDALKDLNLTGNQRRFANQSAIDASDEAILAMKSFQGVISQVGTELVRGVRLEHNAVEADHAAMAGIAGNLSGRLNDTVNQINTSLAATDTAVSGLLGITKIGRF